MFLILRTITLGAVVGVALGLIILAINYWAGQPGARGGYDRHGYVVFAVMLFGAILGALFGLAASLGVYVKKKFEGEEVQK